LAGETKGEEKGEEKVRKIAIILVISFLLFMALAWLSTAYAQNWEDEKTFWTKNAIRGIVTRIEKLETRMARQERPQKKREELETIGQSRRSYEIAGRIAELEAAVATLQKTLDAFLDDEQTFTASELKDLATLQEIMVRLRKLEINHQEKNP